MKILLDSIKHGVQAIILIRKSKNVLNQEFLLIRDHDDRGTGTGIPKYGLAGGGIEEGEYPEIALLRELFEEIALLLKLCSLKKVGRFRKLRPSGFINNNYLFVIELESAPILETNETSEVSEVIILKLSEIIELYQKDLVHEGSMRLICHYLNGDTFGSLNEPVAFNGYKF